MGEESSKQLSNPAKTTRHHYLVTSSPLSRCHCATAQVTGSCSFRCSQKRKVNRPSRRSTSRKSLWRPLKRERAVTVLSVQVKVLSAMAGDSAACAEGAGHCLQILPQQFLAWAVSKRGNRFGQLGSGCHNKQLTPEQFNVPQSPILPPDFVPVVVILASRRLACLTRWCGL